MRTFFSINNLSSWDLILNKFTEYGAFSAKILVKQISDPISLTVFQTHFKFTKNDLIAQS